MSSNLFGTDGIRCSVGQPPLTHIDLARLGSAIARWALTKYTSRPTILLGHDTRVSASFVKSSLTSSMLMHPLSIHDATVIPTPGVCKLMQNSTFDVGIVISASHNPYQDNGIKIIDAHNGKLSENDELEITRLFHSPQPLHSYSSLGSMISWPEASALYAQNMAQKFEEDCLAGITIILDCAQGATSYIAPQLFEQLGARVIVLHAQPNGININDNCGSVHPKTLQQAVLTYQADIGFAFDGDGDRVIAVNQLGEVKDGDDIVAILMKSPYYQQETGVIGTIMSNHGLALWVKENNKQFIRTSVGDKHVSARLEQKNMLLGGEQSGHIIMRDYLNIGDGIFTALRLIQTLCLTNNWDMVSFKKFPQILINVPVTSKKNLDQEPIAALIAAYQEQLPNGRLIVRYSGTEPLLRIMIEDNSQSFAQYLGQQLAQELQENL
jgi:phosphoglucosamine mutase